MRRDLNSNPIIIRTSIINHSRDSEPTDSSESDPENDPPFSPPPPFSGSLMYLPSSSYTKNEPAENIKVASILYKKPSIDHMSLIERAIGLQNDLFIFQWNHIAEGADSFDRLDTLVTIVDGNGHLIFTARNAPDGTFVDIPRRNMVAPCTATYFFDREGQIFLEGKWRDRIFDVTSNGLRVGHVQSLGCCGAKYRGSNFRNEPLFKVNQKGSTGWFRDPKEFNFSADGDGNLLGIMGNLLDAHHGTNAVDGAGGGDRKSKVKCFGLRTTKNIEIRTKSLMLFTAWRIYLMNFGNTSWGPVGRIGLAKRMMVPFWIFVSLGTLAILTVVIFMIYMSQ